MSRSLMCCANILCSILLLTGCGGDKDVAADSNPEQKATAAVSTQAAIQKAETGSVDKTPWSGGAQGYIASGDPATDNVAFLVHAGQISAALNAYRDAGQRLDSLARNNSATAEAR